MKKRIISCTMSAAMLFSALCAVFSPNVLADAYSATQQLSLGAILFPNDIISFDDNSKLIYTSAALNKEVSVGNKMIILPNFSEISTETVTTEGAAFYGWKVISDTIDSTTGKRTSLELAPVFIIYDTTKADLTVNFPESVTNTSPTIKLVAKSGYVADSFASGISYNKQTGEITLANYALDASGNINLGDTYKEEIPTVKLYKGTEQVTELAVCPQSVSQMQFTAKATYSSGEETTENISWSLNDDIEEFISIDNNGLVTVTPYFTGDDFTVIASVGDVSASAIVHLEHSYGEWKEVIAPTLAAPGLEISECSTCHDTRSNPIAQLSDAGLPTGKITVNADANWSELIAVEAINYTHVYKSANLAITASDDIEVKDVSYHVSNTPLTAEQLESVTAWTSGKEVYLTADGKYIVYVKITDSSEKTAYISSNGILIDNTAPVINGIENNSVYYGAKTFTVTETNLAKVTVNGVDAQPENGVYTLSPENLSNYTIVVTDLAGNETTYSGCIYSEDISASNLILGVTEGATYRKGSLIIFSAEGYNMDIEAPKDGDIRFVPYSYASASSSGYFGSTYKRSVSTSKLSVGTQTLSVVFKQQKYSAAEGWTDTGITDTKTVEFKLEKREEIENTRGSLKASFYKISFDTNGGSKLDYVLVDRMKYLKEPVAPTKTGYKFDGWYTNEALTAEYDFSERVTSNMTLYAKWTKTSATVEDDLFSDVSKDDWYYDNIAYVYASGLMNGTGEAEFSPDMPTTRAMIVTILYRLEGEPNTSSSSFIDVSPDSYYADAVAWAQESDIVKGTSAATFSPDKEITREQLMTILYRFAAYKDYDLSSKTGLGNYTDSDQVADYASSAFQWAVATKVASGRTEKFLSPKASATRAEVASAFQNFIEGNVQ